MDDPGSALKRRLAGKSVFLASLRFEPFLALNTLLDPESRIHSTWRARILDTLPGEFFDHFSAIGGGWDIWPVMPSLLPDDLAAPALPDILEGLQRRTLADFQFRAIRGLIHSAPAARDVAEGRLSLRQAISKVPRAKQEWLGYIGLYPYDEDAPMPLTIRKLLSEPADFRRSICRMLEVFWDSCFRDLWARLKPSYARSADRCKGAFHDCSLAEFAQRMLLRVRIDEAAGRIEAIRGGYGLPIRAIRACRFMPSAFNDRRYWSALEQDDGSAVVYFPYFDASIALEEGSTAPQRFSEPRLDPALIFKALGDTTRFAIVSMLARKPTAAVELARRLSVSKPTISHHIHLLREAGLIEGRLQRGAVLLSVRRDVLERLSDLTVRRLYDSGNKLSLKTTRAK